MSRFVQMKDGFDPETTCGLCGGPLNEDGDCDDSAIQKVAGIEWQQVIPTVQGIYLVKRPSSAEIKTFDVYSDDKDNRLNMSLVNSMDGIYLNDLVADKEKETWWYGPIPLPPESC